MITVTNEKVAGFVPRWAAFRGFSILFDNPGNSLMSASGQLACDVDRDEALGFYHVLRDCLACLDLDRLINTYLFCPLPPPSYHVTVWDGANDGNLQDVADTQRHLFEALLAGLPDTLRQPSSATELPAASPLVCTQDWGIRFCFTRVEKWSDIALVACLSPADPTSAEALAALAAERASLSAQYRQLFGIGAYDNYTPHVTLGYFANREAAQGATPYVEGWNRLFTERMEGLVVPFRSAGIYGFTDMATFFRSPGVSCRQ